MKNLGLAMSLKYPGRERDYSIRSAPGGVVIEHWNLPEPQPQNEEQVEKIIDQFEDRLAQREARSEEDYPTLEERVAAVEKKLEEMGEPTEAHGRKIAAEARAKQKIRQRRGRTPRGGQ